MKNYYYLIFCALSFYGCSQVQQATDFITKPSAREVYMRNFKASDSMGQLWNTSFFKAKSNPLEASLPFVISSKSGKYKALALGYTIALQRGEILKISVQKNLDSSVVFIDLFEFEADTILSDKALVSNAWNVDSISYKTKRPGFYKVVIQPELRDSLVLTTKIYTQPSFGFPVLGKGNAAMGSFWGVSRDGGKRSHEGIDIFAARGTPVIAATAGVISFTGNRGLGGQQVWLRDGFFGQSIYYAHLDSILTTTGARVKKGDTLGLVGNTGNAKTTSPHLHFGIYTRVGAINPLPFIKKQNVPTSTSDLTFTRARTKLKKNELRTGANISYELLESLPKDQALEVIGKTEQWYQVRIGDTLEGFMHQSLLQN